MAKKLYDPASGKPYALSRTKVALFMECPRCFYLDRRLGISRPAGFPFNLNSAVDALLKKEFDAFRARGEPHPYLREAGIAAVPHAHPHAAFGIGTLHGLAGSSHLIGVLPSLAFPTRLGSVLYLAAFAAGTVAAMACFSSVLGLLVAASGADRARVCRGLMGACSVAAFGVGGWWLVNGG